MASSRLNVWRPLLSIPFDAVSPTSSQSRGNEAEAAIPVPVRVAKSRDSRTRSFHGSFHVCSLLSLCG